MISATSGHPVSSDAAKEALRVRMLFSVAEEVPALHQAYRLLGKSKIGVRYPLPHTHLSLHTLHYFLNDFCNSGWLSGRLSEIRTGLIKKSSRIVRF